MIIYCITFILSLLIYITVSKGKISKKIIIKDTKHNHYKINRVSIAILLSALPPMFISAVRYYVGTDYLVTYYTGFYRILDGSRVDGFEFGYYWLNRIIQMVTDNVFVLFAITSIIFIAVVYKGIEESSIDIPYSIMMFMFSRYYFIGMNGIRQFIAIAILTYSIKYIVEKNSKKFIICMIFAVSFHYASVLFIPVYFIGRFYMTKVRFIVITAIDIVFFSLGVNIIFRILKSTKYGLLLEKYNVCGLNFTIFTIALNAFLLYTALENYSIRKEDEKYRVYSNIQFFAFLLSLVLRSIPLMERVYWIFSFPIIISVPYFMIGKKKTRRRIEKSVIAIVFFVYMIYDIVILNDHNVLPYQWIFGKLAIHNSGWIWYR